MGIFANSGIETTPEGKSRLSGQGRELCKTNAVKSRSQVGLGHDRAEGGVIQV